MGKDSKERGHKESIDKREKKHHKDHRADKSNRRSHKKDKKKHREYNFFYCRYPIIREIFFLIYQPKLYQFTNHQSILFGIENSYRSTVWDLIRISYKIFACQIFDLRFFWFFFPSSNFSVSGKTNKK